MSSQDNNQTLGDLSLVEAFFYIVLGWVLIAIWERFFDNFFYRTLPFKRNLPYHNFIIAITSTIIFLVLIGSARSIIQQDFANIFDTGPDFTQAESPFGNELLQVDVSNTQSWNSFIQETKMKSIVRENKIKTLNQVNSVKLF